MKQLRTKPTSAAADAAAHICVYSSARTGVAQHQHFTISTFRINSRTFRIDWTGARQKAAVFAHGRKKRVGALYAFDLGFHAYDTIKQNDRKKRTSRSKCESNGAEWVSTWYETLHVVPDAICVNPSGSLGWKQSFRAHVHREVDVKVRNVSWTRPTPKEKRICSFCDGNFSWISRYIAWWECEGILRLRLW